jgi:phosphoribosylformimino-5-aminoimidazole carboxamide ribotide isomerase
VIFPCMDIMEGKIVQLVQGRETALEGGSADEMLQLFRAFPEIQVIDLDSAMGNGANNNRLVEYISRRVKARVGGGVRSVERAQELICCGAHRLIVGTSAFTATGLNTPFLEALAEAVGPERLVIALDSKDGYVVVKGWRESTEIRAIDVVRELDPFCSGYLCTYVDKEGMMQGTDLDWFGRLRLSTDRELTAAGGITTMDDVYTLTNINVNCAIGMAIYTGTLSLSELAAINAAPAS